MLNVHRSGAASYRAVSNEHIQLFYDESAHWLLTSCINGRIHICHKSEKIHESGNQKIYALHKNYVDKFIISYLPDQKQTNEYNRGVFAIVFAE